MTDYNGVYMSASDKDRFIAEAALNKGVDVDKLASMKADSFTDIVRNADALKNAPIRRDVPDMI